MAALRFVASEAFSMRSIRMKRDVSHTGVKFAKGVVGDSMITCCLLTVIICSIDTSLSRRFEELTIFEHGNCISSNRRQNKRKREASFCSMNALFKSLGSKTPNKLFASFLPFINKKIIYKANGLTPANGVN